MVLSISFHSLNYFYMIKNCQHALPWCTSIAAAAEIVCVFFLFFLALGATVTQMTVSSVWKIGSRRVDH